MADNINGMTKTVTPPVEPTEATKQPTKLKYKPKVGRFKIACIIDYWWYGEGEILEVQDFDKEHYLHKTEGCNSFLVRKIDTEILKS